MKFRKALSFLLSLMMIASTFTGVVSSKQEYVDNESEIDSETSLSSEELAEEEGLAELHSQQDPVKSMRTVYLHAQGVNPTVTPNLSVVYMGDDANIYFAVDNPNKGDYDASAEDETDKHLEPHYDLNGYTVKIYFDPAFFALKNDSSSPIDYTVPDANILESGADKEEVGSGDEIKDVYDTPQKPGYFPYKHGSTGIVEIKGKEYRAAYATIFISGSWLPMEKAEELDDEGNPIPAWYNLCNLPLTPLKTGNTEVFIDVDGADPYTLELFAKNTTDEYAQTFEFSTVNGGYHQITIKDKLKPEPPVPEPDAGIYTEKQLVTLKAEDGCEIYYSLDGGATVNSYTAGEKILIETTSDIVTYAKRISDGRNSNTVTYTYKIVPKAPVLYDDADTTVPIPNLYGEYSPYSVLVSDKIPFGNIDDFNEIFYTFSNAALDEKLTEGVENPCDGWAKLDRATKSISINKTEAVRLYTRNVITGEVSDVSLYYLSVKPGEVEADHESGTYNEKIDVKLSTNTEGAEVYYTTNLTDPIANGMLYDPDIPITLYKDTTIRAVAKLDGVYGDVTSFYYIFTTRDDNGVDAFYPSGVYEGDVNVTLTPYNPENTVMYSDDDGKTWQPYTKVIVVDKNTEILAKSVATDGTEGEIYTFTYKIKPLAPEFAPESTQFTNSDKVTIFSPESTNFKSGVTNGTTDRYDLYYTLDGSDPVTSPTRIQADEDSDCATVTIKEYTVISAVVLKDRESSPSYSSVVTHSYDIANQKPVKPITTLTPGSYTHEIGGEPYSTAFLPVPEGTKIYYTVSYDGTFKTDPVPGQADTVLYDGKEISVKGHTILKAVAVNVFGVKSDIGIFEYIVASEAPIAAPSGSISGNNLPVVMINVVEGSTVKYEIGEGAEKFENEFDNAPAIFYIDTNTGNAYRNPDCTGLLGNENTGTITSPATIHLRSELNGIESESNTYVYSLSPNEDQLAPPFPDKNTGVYEEIRAIEGDEDTVLEIKLYSMNHGDTVQYKRNDEAWKDYNSNDSIKLSEDTVLLLRSERNGKYSAVVNYVYNFIPLPPVISLPSGTYSSHLGFPITTISLDLRAPKNKDYDIYFRSNSNIAERSYNGDELEIPYTMSFKAYVENYNTGAVSNNTIRYYIIEDQALATGSVFVGHPFDASRISAHLLSTGDYAKGIKLHTSNKDAKIWYKYIYNTVDGNKYETDHYTFDSSAPIYVNNTMEDITIIAKLLDKDGNEIVGSDRTFFIDFVHFALPLTSFAYAAPEKVEYPRNTYYSLINDYPGDNSITLYYTLNGSDPTDPGNPARMIYKDNSPALKLTDDVVVKTAYFSSCDGASQMCTSCQSGNVAECKNGVYGPIGTYTYTVIKSAGSAFIGSGSPNEHIRKYTEDYFGYEHPTHISYINGYPDGSVKADGSITREEMATILYRVKNKQYDAPFITTGKVFPDVAKDRWSATEIEYMTNDKVILGYPEGDFRPTNKLTRAEFAALICRFTNLPAPTKRNVFDDLEKEHWAYDEILSLYSAGFLNGYEDGTVRPDREITRAEVMKVMNIILGRKPLESYIKSMSLNPFTDLESDKWYYVDVLEATITHVYILNSKNFEKKWEGIK